MKTKFLLTFIITLLTAHLGHAHALWIETPSEGQLNKRHTVHVYYGEYAEQSTDPIDKWYSDVRDFELYLINPNGERTKLDKEADSDHFSSSFIPTENGTYTLSIVHGAKEAYETMRFEFSSIAFVKVGGKPLTDIKQGFHLKPLGDTQESGAEIDLAVLDHAVPQTGAEVIVMGPDGWTKTMKSDSDGKVVFKPLIPGKYIIEASRTDDKKEDWRGQKIEKIWRGSTLAIQVK